MPFVLDASTTLAWVFDDENHPGALAALSRIRTDEAHVPSLWWFEVRNALIANERRGRLTGSDTARFLRHLTLFDIAVDLQPDDTRVLEIARRQCLSVYGAVYLELAQRESIPLSTLDLNLARAARDEKVDLLGEPS